MKKFLLLLLGLITLSSQAQLAIEGFEGSSFPPPGWSVYNSAGPEFTWQQSDPLSPFYPPYEGAHAAFLQKEDVAEGVTEDFLVTPEFTIPVNPTLHFMSRLTIQNDQNTIYKVMMLLPGDDPSDPDDYIAIVEYTELEINPEQMEYKDILVNLPAQFTGQNVRLAFVMQGDNGERWLIDNVHITSACPAPTNLSATDITGTTAALGWTGTGNETTWEIEIIPGNGTPTGNGVVYTGTAPYVVTGLEPSACYKYYVRSICTQDNPSTWSGPYTFCTTGCDPVNQCMYTFNLTDAGFNGWNGAQMVLKQNGQPIYVFTNNFEEEISTSMPLCHDVSFELEWVVMGSAPDDVQVSIINPYGQLIYSMPAGSVSEPGILHSWTTDCMVVECWAPYNLNAEVENLDVTLSWISQGTNYEYYIMEQGAPYPTDDTQGIAVTSTEVELTNFNANTDYQYFVRLHCTEDVVSPWSEPFNFSIGTGNSISGVVLFDINNDGVCDNNDTAMPSIEILVSLNGIMLLSTYTNADGEFMIDNLPDGINTYTLQALAPEGYNTIAPVSQTIDFSTTINPSMSICIPFEDVPDDISVVMLPVTIAQPGFNALYEINVLNNSPLTISNATVTIEFDDAHVQFQNLSAPYLVENNSVTFDTGVIEAYNTNVYNSTFYIYPPMVNIGGEQLVYTATVSTTDDTPESNTHVLNQTTVNSYDPNDITVHEGPFIYEEQADDYLTYTIRFQNTGTANAVNIRLENTLDELLDWGTFVPITSSHNYYVTRNGNQLTFNYPNIQLPDSTANEPDSHGFVTYRIKPKSTFGLGDIVSNTAEIYFDFNPPIITNTATTEVIEALGTAGFNVVDINLYPNPVQDKLHIVADYEIISVHMFDMNGREINVVYNSNSFDTSLLSPGMYIVKVTTGRGTSTHKVLKQ